MRKKAMLDKTDDTSLYIASWKKSILAGHKKLTFGVFK